MRYQIGISDSEIDKFNTIFTELFNNLFRFCEVYIVIFMYSEAEAVGKTITAVKSCGDKGLILNCIFYSINTIKIKSCSVFKTAAIEPFS